MMRHDSKKTALLPPGQRASSKFPRFGVGWRGTLPEIPQAHCLRISGAVNTPFEISLEQLHGLRRKTRIHDFHCVTTWTQQSLEWSGWCLVDVYRQLIEPRCQPRSDAPYLVCFGLDGYRATLHLDDALSDEVLIADRLDGEPLSTMHGAPLRLVCPSHYGYKSIKHLAGFGLRAERPRNLRYGLEHPRGRVAFEERNAVLPAWLVRVVYRTLIAPTAYLQGRRLTSSDRVGRPTLLDALMPAFDTNEVHHIWVPATPEKTYAALIATTGREIRLLGPLMALRTLPALLAGRKPPADKQSTVIDGLVQGGFVRLGEETGREIVLGVVGQFWKPVGNQPTTEVSDRESFLAFAQPDYTKATLNFLVRREGSGSRIITETRIVGTDAAARRKFRRYWFVIRGGSGAIRRSWLAAIRRRLERDPLPDNTKRP